MPSCEVRVMRTAETILHVIRNRGRRQLPLERVYRLLFNRELFLLAYVFVNRKVDHLIAKLLTFSPAWPEW